MKYLIREIIIICLVVGIFVAQLTAQNNNNRSNALISQLKATSSEMNFNDGRLSGEGADFLLREANKSHFFLIGEEHGFAENPLLAAALLQQLNDYQFFAAEIGKLTAARLEAAARKRNVPEVLAEFNHQYPFSLPFFNWQEEGKLLEVALGRPRSKIPHF